MRDNGFGQGSMEDVPEYGSDSVRIAFNFYGFILELGSMTIPEPPSEQPPIKRVAVVKMSPQHVMIFTRLLQKHLESYQEKFGPISIPPEIYRQMGLEEGG